MGKFESSKLQRVPFFRDHKLLSFGALIGFNCEDGGKNLCDSESKGGK